MLPRVLQWRHKSLVARGCQQFETSQWLRREPYALLSEPLPTVLQLCTAAAVADAETQTTLPFQRKIHRDNSKYDPTWFSSLDETVIVKKQAKQGAHVD